MDWNRPTPARWRGSQRTQILPSCCVSYSDLRFRVQGLRFRILWRVYFMYKGIMGYKYRGIES